MKQIKKKSSIIYLFFLPTIKVFSFIWMTDEPVVSDINIAGEFE
jgi:hypothetical protein